MKIVRLGAGAHSPLVMRTRVSYDHPTLPKLVKARIEIVKVEW